MPSVVVVGGSLGGLTAALVLRDAGCDVRVFERSASALQARGAGIAALDATLRYLTERGGLRPEDVCSSTGWIRFLRGDGSTEHEQRHRYRFSSWNTIYRSLLPLFDSRPLPARPRGGLVRSGRRRSQRHPRRRIARPARTCWCAPTGSARPPGPGWSPASPRSTRATWPGAARCPERDASPATRRALDDAITYQVLDGSHILVYPIPALDGSLLPGDRLINVVWYVNVAAGPGLDQLMTGRDGIRRAVSLPPGAATDRAVTGMRRAAADVLAAPIAEVVTGMAEPFVQAIYDLGVPRMAFGRTCLIGDAAFAVRPHAAAGTAKAADDAWALAEELTASGGDVPVALAAWERRQLGVGRALLARTRDIGDSSQFSGTFRPGDPKLIFGLHGPGR